MNARAARSRRRLALAPAATALLSLAACQARQSAPTSAAPTGPGSSGLTVVPFEASELREVLRMSPLPELPPDPTNRFADDPRAVAFGQRLFFDERFSGRGDTSCASCHDPSRGWADGRQLGEGIIQLNRHSMSLWNASYQRWLMWDGRADSLWAQALGPLENSLEHSGTRLEVAHLIHDDAQLRSDYQELFGELPDLDDEVRFPPVGRPVPDGEGHEHSQDPPPQDAKSRGLAPRRGHWHPPGQGFIHPHQRAWDFMAPQDQRAISELFVNVGKSLAAFERRIVSGPTPFDTFVEGLRERDPARIAALEPAAQRGLKLFVGRAGCVSCHGGPLLSDREFHDNLVPPLEPDMPPDLGRLVGLELVKEDPFNGVGEWSDDVGGEAELKLSYLPEHSHQRFEFRTPGLRNVALSPPYMHQGQLATLEQVVRYYSTLEGARTDPPPIESILKPLNLTEREVQDMVAFLEALTAPGDVERAVALDPR